MSIAEIQMLGGRPTLFVHGKPTAPNIFVLSDPNDVSMVAKAGIHLYQIMFPLGWKGPGRYSHDEVDRLMKDTVDRDRYACVIPRVLLKAPDWWLDSHPDEMCVLDDGRRIGWSFASRTWMDEVSEAFIDLVQHVRDAPYARHVIGYHPDSGHGSEWLAS